MESLHTKDCNHSKVSSPNFESFESKDSENDSSPDRILKVFSRKFESFDTKDCENSEVSIGNFQSFEPKL